MIKILQIIKSVDYYTTAHKETEPVENLLCIPPSLVIRGESRKKCSQSEKQPESQCCDGGTGLTRPTDNNLKEDGESFPVFIDFLSITFPYIDEPEAFLEIQHLFSEGLDKGFSFFNPRRTALLGYQVSFEMGSTGGIFSYGGQNDTAFVSLPSSACARITDWNKCYLLFHEILNAKITRCDIAVDVFNGSPSVDDAVQLYLAGKFNNGGKKPSCSQSGNWIEPDGRGRALSIGNRENNQFIRIYQKGKQLGDPNSPWTRWELELHSRRNWIIPWEVILKPSQYLAGAYPCMGWVDKVQTRIKSIQKENEISYEFLVKCLRNSYGKLINVMLEVEGSAEKVIERLIREGIPSRLDLGANSTKDKSCKK